MLVFKHIYCICAFVPCIYIYMSTYVHVFVNVYIYICIQYIQYHIIFYKHVEIVGTLHAVA